ncbi:recombinase family protein [Nocardia gipuzkoensis]
MVHPTVSHILHNPKYTGYQVYNRARVKTPHHPSKTNPPNEWIWSPQPAHPAIITIEQFTTAQTIAPITERSRSDRYPGAPNPHPHTKNVYKLRSYITCAHCGRRLCGKTDSPTRIYYICQPPKQTRPQGHPATVILPEDLILTAINEYFNTHILGTSRRPQLRDLLHTLPHREHTSHRQQIDALHHDITRIETSRHRLVRNLGLFDPDTDHTTIDHIKQQLTDLQTQHETATTQLTALTYIQAPLTHTIEDLLDLLPNTDIGLDRLPTPLLRQLLDAYHFTARYDHRDHHAHLTINISQPNRRKPRSQL